MNWGGASQAVESDPVEGPGTSLILFFFFFFFTQPPEASVPVDKCSDPEEVSTCGQAGRDVRV